MRKIALIFIICCLISVQAFATDNCTVETWFSPYDNVEEVILSNLDAAQSDIVCSLYGITNVRITEALKFKQKQGLRVFLALDKTQSAGKSSTHEALRKTGVNVTVKKASALEHNKWCIIDNKLILTGSWNFSGNAQKQDNTFYRVTNCSDEVKRHLNAFQRIYDRDKGGK